jgi:pimeloyl-ACP methyl ester carboxylesterase
MDALGHEQFAVVGVDTGMLIGYALAADHPDRVVRLAVGEAPLPGITPPTPLILPDPVVDRLWHIPFNQLEETNEKLVRGREDVFFGAEFSASAGTKKLSDDNVKYYVDGLASSPEALHGSFQLYRAFGATAAQNVERKNRGLPMPVLAMGGAESSGSMPAETMKLAADDVQSLVIPGVGHWLAEQAPDELVAALTEFLAPYRDGEPDVAAAPAAVSPDDPEPRPRNDFPGLMGFESKRSRALGWAVVVLAIVFPFPFGW